LGATLPRYTWEALEMLSLLDAGDILAHVSTHRKGEVITAEGSVLPAFKGALEKGVTLDTAPAQSHLSFELLSMALDQGVISTTISTDITVTNYQGPMLFSLPVVMSKFLALSLHEVIAKTTATPARVLGEEGWRGSLRVGMTADVALFELARGIPFSSMARLGTCCSGAGC